METSRIFKSALKKQTVGYSRYARGTVKTDLSQFTQHSKRLEVDSEPFSSAFFLAQ